MLSGIFIFIGYNISYHQHAGINAIRFAGMNAIIDKDDSFIILADIFKIIIAIVDTTTR